MRKDYASELTKEELIRRGIAWVDVDTKTVYGSTGVPLTPIINNCGYLMIGLYRLDSNGNKIKRPKISKWKNKDGTINSCISYCYEVELVGLHRILWAWKFGKVPAGYVVDHINNHHERLEDYDINTNLQCITQAENLAKERPNSNTKILKSGYNRGIDYYQKKLNYYIEEYQKAKAEHRADDAHRLRSNIANQKGKIRYLLGKGK